MRFTRWFTVVSALAAFAAFGCNDDDETHVHQFTASMNAAGEIPPANPVTLTANMTGAAEVPAVTTSATGIATLTPGVNALAYTITLTNATAVSQAHIHDGAPGENGTVLTTLFTGPTTGDTTGLLASGTITTLPTSIASWDAYFTKLRAGDAYVNVHTTAHPGGEIRSQTAMVGNATFESDGNTVSFKINVHNAIGVIGAHIHSGNAGVANGAIRVTLYNNPAGSALINGTLVSGEFDAGDVTGISLAELLDEMHEGNAYLNVHTLVYTGGAIRGQIDGD